MSWTASVVFMCWSREPYLLPQALAYPAAFFSHVASSALLVGT